VSIENAIIAKIAALNTGAGSRVYREIIVQEPQLPAVAVSRTSGQGMARTLGNNPLLYRAVLRIETVGETMAQVSPVAEAIRAGLDGWTGTQSGVTVLMSRLSQQQEQADAMGDRTMRIVQQDFEFVFR
jgi:hypothetical protein